MNQEPGQSEKPCYYLGIDWGASRVGLAIADDVMRISTGLEEVQAQNALEKISKLDQQHDFGKFVLGNPVQQAFPSKKEFEIFLAKLQQLGKEVVLENEFFSTKVAQNNLAQLNKKGISHADNVESARLILQGFLDKSLKK